ncbi:glycine-rich domain-containing protein 2 [Senna tora]|uniref:Glycine-rich domain-containing protein 2 n=1 Tax=Senna tora TaxID=362788 RepID=A0A834WFZ8_9FABA|nr:glycine-rich domain-containing protein 2 [Senna tora]
MSESEISTTSLNEIAAIRFGIDLVSAARTNLGLLRTVADSHSLHHTPTLLHSIRRYHEFWMPLISDLTLSHSPPMILPPFDVHLVWFCHTLNPVSYREYCETKFSKLIGRAAIFDEENEEYALMRCREIWNRRYPSEPFENEAYGYNYNVSDSQEHVVVSVSVSVTNEDDDLFKQVRRHRLLYSKFCEAYRSEVVYLIAARQRYKAFLHMLQRLGDDGSTRLVPTSDIMLMWLTHQSYPTVYIEDLKALALEGDMWKVTTLWENPKEKEVEMTKKLWDNAFNQPYEKAGGGVAFTLGQVTTIRSPVYWEESDTDVNAKYKSMLPRFLLEVLFPPVLTAEFSMQVCVFLRLNSSIKALQKDINRDFLRLQVVRCHSELKLDKAFSSFPFDSWEKAWQLYCEFGTKGVIIEYRRRGGSNCLKGSSLQSTVTFRWNDLLRANSLTLEKELSEHVSVVTSITPPVQAPYLLKCVPDRVTDDSGAMISDVILKMNNYRPQEGRWLSRTVLDHAGRECFVIRIRVGGGFWRRGAETPSAVKWEDRIIEIREGSWSYVGGSIGRAPENVVATATPKESGEQWKAAWCFSTGDELIIQWESSLSMSGFSFSLRNQTSPESWVKLMKGRQMQYQVVKKTKPKNKNEENHIEEEEDDEDDDEGFVTLVRFTEENPNGKATALLNWRLLVVELLPEEDAVLALLLCISILKSVSEMKKEDVGGLLMRRRIKEQKLGSRDWGSVILDPSSMIDSSPYLQPWYWNADAVMASSDVADHHLRRQPAINLSPEEGSDKLYKSGLLS